SDAIESALRNTDWLIVIATPRFPQSKWCAKEIERFTELYGQDHILVVLADGTPEESIPEVLRFRQNGAVDEIIADVRGKNSLDEAALRIAARMYDLDPEELKHKVRERQVKRIAAVSAFAAAVLLLFAMYCAAQFTRISAQNDMITAQNAELQE
ncbi:MAG: TIR domain-containing protein, partial [Stomatobaculum sp.]|nr:TIR domain-containing protein [Stomatobaculum sp.]